MPTGTRSDGLRGSLTLIGRADSDGHLAGLGAALIGEATAAPARAAAGRIEIAVVGAHLSGLPLNGELTALGGGFVRTADTTPDYRLFALPGTTPPRPGLLRVADRHRRRHRHRNLVARRRRLRRLRRQDPVARSASAPCASPMARTVKGFLVEAEAINGAKDISEFGGWRNFLAAKEPD